MAFPPLKDPDEAPEERDQPAKSDERAAAVRPDSDPAAPPDDAPADDDTADTAPYVDDDDLEELNDRIDPDDLDEYEDLVEHRAHNTPIPADAGTAAALAADIPMLTEVVQVPRYDSEDLPQTLADVDWGDLSQRVRENVLERLLRRSDALLDAQLQNTLAPILERAVDTVAHELHDALNRMIRDIVARAVTEELTRLHAEIANRNRAFRAN
jgi:hypothetical protein